MAVVEEVHVLAVYEDSAGAFVGHKLGDRMVRKSLYYATLDQAQYEFETGTWRPRSEHVAGQERI